MACVALEMGKLVYDLRFQEFSHLANNERLLWAKDCMSPLLQTGHIFFKLLEKQNIWGKRTSSSTSRVDSRTVASIIRNVGMKEASAQKGRNNEGTQGWPWCFGSPGMKSHFRPGRQRKVRPRFQRTAQQRVSKCWAVWWRGNYTHRDKDSSCVLRSKSNH